MSRMKVLNWIKRIAVVSFAIIVIGLICILIGFSYWKSRHIKELELHSEVITTARGNIEVAIVGKGVPELIIHGTPGGYDQALIGLHVQPEDFEGFQIVAVSRPGYLRTPLSSGKTPSERADLYGALLDKIGIDRVVVYAASGGAPSGLQFALRHPNRVHGLILVVPVLQSLAGDPPSAPSSLEIMVQETTTWLLGKYFIPSIIPGIDLKDPRQNQAALELIDTTLPVDRRTEGMINDERQFRMLDVDSWALENLEVPTLILHGDADQNVPFTGSQAAAKRMPNAKLVTFSGGDHFIVLTRATDISGRVKEFLSSLKL